MTKVEIDGKTYCVETLIYEVERLTKDVKASAEHHRLVLEQIRDEIVDRPSFMISTSEEYEKGVNAMLNQALMVIDKYRAERITFSG